MSVVDQLRDRWARDDLEYVRLAATTLLVLVLLPLVLARLIINPLGAANQALMGAAR